MPKDMAAFHQQMQREHHGMPARCRLRSHLCPHGGVSRLALQRRQAAGRRSAPMALRVSRVVPHRSFTTTRMLRCLLGVAMMVPAHVTAAVAEPLVCMTSQHMQDPSFLMAWAQTRRQRRQRLHCTEQEILWRPCRCGMCHGRAPLRSIQPETQWSLAVRRTQYLCGRYVACDTTQDKHRQ